MKQIERANKIKTWDQAAASVTVEVGGRAGGIHHRLFRPAFWPFALSGRCP
ncbi:MAG: hypothetical protein R2792_05365 [Saprospiraceae bacterium]